MGIECQIDKERLQFLGRWTPKESVEDYARSSRAVTLGVIKEVGKKIREGWLPDESLTGLRAQARGNKESVEWRGFLCGDCRWTTQRAEALGSEGPEVGEVNPVEASKDQMESEQSLLLVVYDAKTLVPGKLHWAKQDSEGTVLETGCGKTMGRDVKVWTEHRWKQEDTVDFQYTSTCSGYRCRDFFASWGTAGAHTMMEDEVNESDEQVDSAEEDMELPIL